MTSMILGAGGFTGEVQSQAAIEEIVVIAQKREQRLEDVGLAVSVFSGARIRELGFTQSVELAAMTPGVSRSGSSCEQTAQFSIRGVTQKFDGFLNVSYGSYNLVRVEGAVGGSVTKDVSGRISVLYNHHDTIIDNTIPAGLPEGFSGSEFGQTEIWNDDQWAARGQLLLDINDRADLLVSAYTATQQPSVGNWQHLPTTAVSNEDGT